LLQEVVTSWRKQVAGLPATCDVLPYESRFRKR
jgi:hypothetical protein